VHERKPKKKRDTTKTPTEGDGQPPVEESAMRITREKGGRGRGGEIEREKRRSVRKPL